MFASFLRRALAMAAASALVTLLFGLRAEAIGLNQHTLFGFDGYSGDTPFSGLIIASDRNFYGTTFFGGSSPLANSGNGLVYKMSSDGVVTGLAVFYGTNGASPYAGLVQGNDGLLYGTTYSGGTNGLPGGNGTVFCVSTNGALATLVHFNGANGAKPSAALLLGADGNFYGTTSAGGASDKGTVFSMTPAGVLTSMFSFNGANGNNPYSGLTQGADGALYGTTIRGGTNGDWGTVYRITTNGTFSSLLSFGGANGSNPYGSLVQATNGLLYGTAYYGGLGFNGQISSGFGEVYQISTNGSLDVQYQFTGGNDGGEPYAGLALGKDGNLYGSTTLFGGVGGYGTVFQITPDALLTTIVTFYFGTNGITPYGQLLALNSGVFYGTTSSAGANGRGTVFRLDPAQPRLSGATNSGGKFSFTWSALPGQTFQVEYRTNLASSAWYNLGSQIVATNTTVTATDTWVSTRNCSYRVTVVP